MLPGPAASSRDGYRGLGAPFGMAAALLNTLVTDIPKDKWVFLCGPPSMTAVIEAELRTCGFDSRNIHTEAFQLWPALAVRENSATLILRNGNHTGAFAGPGFRHA